MEKGIKKYTVLLLTFLVCMGCADLEKINTDPDGITSATPNVLATKLILDITRDDFRTGKGFMLPFLRDKYILWTEFAQDEQYNDIGRVSFNTLPRLIEAQKMMEGADQLFDPGEVASYKALGHFVRAYTFFNLSMQVGDIPFNDALQGETNGELSPKYDTQKAVFLGILDELDMADTLFAQGNTFSGDMVYNGDPQKWRKMVNSFALKVLMNLANKEGDTDINVVQRFGQIANGRPIFSGNEDNFSLVYQNAEGQKYPFFKEGNSFLIYPMVSADLIDALRENQDYRLFYYAAPSGVKLSEGSLPSDFESYVGVDPAMEYAEVTGIYATGDYSDINLRYKEEPEGEPVYLLSYAQVKFLLAEASVRGWLASDAETHYREGIAASMQLIASVTPEDEVYNHGRLMDEAYINGYYAATPQVHLTGSETEQLEQIMVQKYLSGFLQSPMTSFYENRRTGFPAFTIKEATNLNLPSDRFPVRWMYPSSELQYNSENVNAAIDRQYNGVDDTNGLMWILQ